MSKKTPAQTTETQSTVQPISDTTSEETGGLRLNEVTESHDVQLTTYQDASQTTTDVAPGVTPDSLWSGTNTLPDQGLSAVLGRSYQIGVYNWTNSPVGTDILPNTDMLRTLLAIPNIAEKVAYYKYFRCKGINLTLRVNATPWHYGTIGISSTVNNSHEFHNSSHPNLSQFFNNRFFAIDAASADAVNYEIHWKSKAQWYDVKAQTPSFIMTPRITVGVPLSMIGSVLKDAKITLFANFIDPEVAMPIADSIAATRYNDEGIPIATAQSGRSAASKEARTKSESGITVSDVKSFADTTFEIVETASEVAGKLAPLMAFMADKPTSLRPSDNVVVMPGTDMPGFHGLDNTVKLCGDPEASAGFDSGVIGESIGNPSIYTCVQTPGYVGSWSFNTGTAAGTKLYTIPLSVTGQCIDNANTFTVSPLTWHGILFKFWRGSFKVLLHFASSSFITARIRMVWIPPGHTAPTTIADDESGDYISEVLEVTGSMNHTEAIPYISDLLYKRVSNSSNDDLASLLRIGSTASETSLGSLAFYLITPVVTVDSAIPPTITCLTWIAAGEDFQFSNFSGQIGSDPSVTWQFGPVPPATQQTSIMDEFSKPFDTIVEASSSYELGIATSETYEDVVTLGKRYGGRVLKNPGANDNDYSADSAWDQVILKSGAVDVRYPQQWLTACFVNFRGSVRYKFFWSESFDTGGSVAIQGSYLPPSGSVVDRFQSSPIFFTNNKSNNYVSFELPWITRVPFLNRHDDPSLEGLNAFVLLPVTSNLVNISVGRVGVALGDDFAVGVFQAPPGVIIANPPLLPDDDAPDRRRSVLVHKNE